MGRRALTVPPPPPVSPVSPLRPEDPLRLGDYRLTGRLGVGGQGTVFLGLPPGEDGRVAVKLLHARLGDDSARRGFAREIEAVRRVAPFCTAQVLDADLDGDRPYIVSEYVDGPSLREHVAAAGPRAGGDLDRVAVGTATALAAIHRAGVVHRDFKPGNVLLGSDGVRVVDFGISRLSDAAATTGAPMGTPAYIAPEQLKGRPGGPAADVFCWALTLVYAASGRHAYSGGTSAEVMARILYGTPDLGPLTGVLRDLVVACLAAEPADRPDAGQVLNALLDRASTHAHDTRAGERRTGDRLPRDVRSVRPGRRRTVVAAAAIVAVLAVAGVAWALTAARTPGRLDGVWTGMAKYPLAGRVFPVEVRLSAPARMRWGADLHCSGRLIPVRTSGEGVVLALDQVKGDACHPGNVTLTWKGDREASVEVTRDGESGTRYSGTLARTN